MAFLAGGMYRRGDAWPKDRGFCTGDHGSDTTMCGVEGKQDFNLEVSRDDYSVSVSDDAVNRGQMFPKLVIFLQLLRQHVAGFGHA